ncbi:alpha/beta hydrolase [Mesorhizobium sp. WSM2561]|uniref:alpha/beta hydrolase n=1 Tax=Mesorhizobium sp. WSM2561 TaxID=1040985 RepID=UPI0004BB79C9|nr:alpha/beta hydrolase [Mesorhizobium sp. WSM2561]
MWLLKLTLAVAGLYAVIVAVVYALQSWLIFPAGLAASGPDLPAGVRHVELATEDGERVVLVRLPGRQAPAEPRPLLLGFAGNAWNADALALMLHQLFPEHEVAALHYRGYAPSSGSPSAAALLDDARRAHDHLAGDAKAGIVAVGLSIGAAVAADLATARPLRGIIMVTPFDSLRELAAHHYPWLPVRLLLRHRIETAETLRNLDVPTAVITAENDTIVPAARSAPLREAARDLRSHIAIAAGHNDLYGHPDFAGALRASVAAVTRD